MTDYLLDPADLESLGIRTVIVASPDLQGRLFGRRVPASRFSHVLERGIEVCTCVFAWDIGQSMDVIAADTLPFCGMHNGVPDFTLKVDLGTLRRAAWLDNVAICFADPVDGETGEPLAISPRVQLRREVERYEAAGLVPKTGTELEFYLFLNDQRELRDSGFRDLKPTTATPADFLFEEGNYYEPFFQKLRDDLAASGIDVEAAQSEWGTGQWEMTFVYGDPLEMADRHLLYKLAVRDSARRAGMTATFMARPINGQPGSSCHVHFSVRDRDGSSAFWDKTAEFSMSERMRHALAGALEHAPDFMGLYSPTVNSWQRNNSEEVAGFGRTWGHDNRTTSVRVLGHRPEDIRFEFRLPGADTNPYLTLTGLLASARDGIEHALELAPAVKGNAYALPSDQAMPRDLRDAARTLGESDFVKGVFGADVTQHMRVLLDYEWEQFVSYISDWHLNRYFDRV